MDLFVEKEFIENFEIEYTPEKYSEIQKIIFDIFSKYARIKLFANASKDFIQESELLSRITDINTQSTFNVEFNKVFTSDYNPNPQKLVFTEKNHSWFSTLRNKGVLCFYYNTLESDIREFIEDTEIFIDLSDKENIPIDWKVFNYLNKIRGMILITDNYVLSDTYSQRIKDNLAQLLSKNLNKDNPYKIFFYNQI